MPSIEQVLGEVVAASLTEALTPLVEAVTRLNGKEPHPEVYRVDEAAVVLGTSPATVRRWVDHGLLGRLPGTSTVLIPRRSVESFIGEAEERALAVRKTNHRN
jgi:excisionase family DNA binding protein